MSEKRVGIINEVVKDENGGLEKVLTTKSMSVMAPTGMEASGRGHCGAAEM